ncbi:hypothetical protein SEVIR_9G315000v4 [Setaria viridis]|uniref:Uncharacterized protein n=1 Tax=Setaria viridis TaxID=4556 RepID=A0A4U6T424_SETVI|nr:uncharacterized protein LOC117836504 isoform X2 [Setaria viridis]TKV94732.1 hypothetical protein SEVIR_9G315000v2 [Setaria viridis]
MQRLSLGSPGGRPSRVSAAAEEEAGPADEKAAKAAVARAPAAPDRSIHLVPVLTLLCFLVLFLLSHDPSAAAATRTDSPVLAAAATVTARSLDAAAAGAAEATTASSGVYRRLKQSRVRRLGMARRML